MLLKRKNMTKKQMEKFAENTIDLGQSIIKSSLLGIFSLPLVLVMSKNNSVEDMVSNIASMSNNSFNLIVFLITFAVIIGTLVRDYGYKLLPEDE